MADFTGLQWLIIGACVAALLLWVVVVLLFGNGKGE